jgi:SagB-type dehydrogenase family enzyme
MPRKSSVKGSTPSKTRIGAAASTHQHQHQQAQSRTEFRTNERPDKAVKIVLSPLSLVKRAASIVCYWNGPQLAISNYRTRVTITVTPVMVLLLSLLNDWLSPAEITRLLPGFKGQNVLRAVRKLLRHGVLVQKNSPAALQDEALLKSWAPWLPHAGFFHFGTKDVRYESRPRELMKIQKQLLEASPQPAFYKAYRGSARVRLQRPKPEPGFAQVLMQRRTQREFSRKELSFEALSKLLFYTWGVTGFLEVPALGRLPLKTSPSAGARHPVEAYVLGMRIEGLEPGLYHYDARAHGLERLRTMRDVSGKAAQFCVDQPWAREAAALFIMTAVFPRAMWKYPTSRAYRTVLLDAGHVCQTFCLVATWLGLAAFCTMALRDSLIEKELGINGVAESVIYIAGVGMPVLDSTAVRRRNLALASL